MKLGSGKEEKVENSVSVLRTFCLQLAFKATI